MCVHSSALDLDSYFARTYTTCSALSTPTRPPQAALSYPHGGLPGSLLPPHRTGLPCLKSTFGGAQVENQSSHKTASNHSLPSFSVCSVCTFRSYQSGVLCSWHIHTKSSLLLSAYTSRIHIHTRRSNTRPQYNKPRTIQHTHCTYLIYPINPPIPSPTHPPLPTRYTRS